MKVINNMSSIVKHKLTSFQIIILGFAGVILLGSFILMLPVSSNAGVVTPFDDALFTVTSAVCVTGLVVYDTATYWSGFGQAVILILIQIGGLGVVTIASFTMLLAGKKFSLMQRQTMQNALSSPQMGGIVRLTKFLLATTIIIEGIGAVLLIPVFVPAYGKEGIWMSVFHSISAFCNAGFDLMGNKTGHFSSLTSYAGNEYLCVIIALLIILGGLGFITWDDVITKKGKFKEYKMQTKVILVTTAVLIVLPTIFFFFVDFADVDMSERLCMSFFQAVTPRTAGFNTADQMEMTDAGRAVTMILMMIGGSPGSTAGGMKTTTFIVLIANSIAVFRKRQHVDVFGRRIEDSIVKDAATIIFLYVTLAMSSSVAISVIEGLPMQSCMFETFSAIATVGLSLGLTPGLGTASHMILVLLMFWGRVGGLTIIYAALSRKDISALKYPLENIIVG